MAQDNQQKISRRAFLNRSLFGAAALGLAPLSNVLAWEAEPVKKWAAEASGFTFYLIGNGHIDPVWLWSWREGISVVMSTFQAALDRMNENPGFKFTASSAQFYQWVAENDPQMLEQIKRRVEEGRWEVVGGWWIEPDVNIPSGEALVRQGLYGQLTLEKLVGRRATVGFNPDSFGHPETLPQILLKQGLKQYVFMRPMAHEKTLPAQLFHWKGPDGSSVPTYHIEYGYGYNRDLLQALDQRIGDYADQKMRDWMFFYGAGDHGGGPTKKFLTQVTEVQAQKGAPKLVYSRVDDYFQKMLSDKSIEVPTLRDELQMHAVGCYTAESMIKKGNRQGETALTTAEKIAGIGSSVWGAAYPMAALRSAWERLLYLQFHDSLAGTSLSDHSEMAREGYGFVIDTAEQAMAMALQKLEWQIASEDPASEYFVVFNPHAWTVDGYVAYDIEVKHEVSVVDEQGRPLPYQWAVGSSQTGNFRKLLVRVDVPAMGYRQVRVRPGEAMPIAEPASANGKILENSFLQVSFSEAGTIGLTDKKTGREWFIGGETGAKAVVLEDTSDTWSHDVVAYTDEIGAFGEANIQVIENGPLRATVRVRSTYNDSSLTIDWTLWAGSPRLDARVELDWHERHKMMRFSFPVNVESPTVTYEVPYGAIERPRQGQEVPGGRWVDLSGKAGGASCGLSVLNDAKYGYSTLGNDVRVSVVRGQVFAHHAPNKLDPQKEYPWMDQGIQTFRMQLIPHAGDRNEARIVQRTEEFSVPPIPTYQGIHGGHLPKSGSWLSLESPGVVLTAIKQAEDGKGLIFRCVELSGKACPARLEIAFAGVRWSGDFGAFEIKSLRLDLRSKTISEVDLLEE